MGFSLQWLPLLYLEGLVALQPVGSSWMRGGTLFFLAGRHPTTGLPGKSPEYIILFDTMNGIFFLISFSDCSLLIYRNTTYFCVLILYLTTLLKLFTLIFFRVDSLRFSTYKIMSLAVKIVLFLPFPLNVSYFLFCLIALARTSSTVLNRSVRADMFILFLS